MGNSQPSPDTLINIELENRIPIVGIPIKPKIVLNCLGGCIFQWYRLPSVSSTASTNWTDDEFLQQCQLISQSVDYTPTSLDVQHSLLFCVHLLITQQGIQKYIITDPCIPLPSHPPNRNWIALQQFIPTLPPTTKLKSFTSFSIDSQTLDKRFTLVSYSLCNELFSNYKQQYNQCPSFVFSSLFRSKVFLKELFMYSSDLICLQKVEDGKSYDDMYLEVSKNGYSGIFDVIKSTKKQDRYYGLAIMYKRSKLNKINHWNLHFEQNWKDIQNNMENLALNHEDSILLQQLSCIHETIFAKQDSMINFNDNLAMVVFFELKQFMFHSSSRDVQDMKKDEGKLFVVTVQFSNDESLWSKETKEKQTQLKHYSILFKLLLLFYKCKVLQRELKAEHIAVVFAGDFDFVNIENPIYSFLSQGNLSHEKLALPNQDPLPHPTCTCPYSLQSGYYAVLNREVEYALSDQHYSKKKVTDFVWFPSDKLECVAVMKDPTTSHGCKSIPNQYFASDHFALQCQFQIGSSSSSVSPTMDESVRVNTVGQDTLDGNIVSTGEASLAQVHPELQDEGESDDELASAGSIPEDSSNIFEPN